jgi:hypothetical protein
MRHTLIFLLSLLLIVSCENSSSEKTNEDSIPDTTTVRITQPKINLTFISADEFSIGIPSHMYPVAGLNADATIQYADTMSGIYMIVVSDPKAGMINTLRQLRVYEENLGPEKNYRKANMQMMSGNLAITSVPVIEEKTLNGLNAEIVVFNGIKNGVNAVYKTAFIEGEMKMHTILCWSVANQDQNGPEMDEIINSFRVSTTPK